MVVRYREEANLHDRLQLTMDLHQRIRERESHVNSTRTPAPRTFNHNTNLVMFIRIRTAVRIKAFCNSHDLF
jgi:hypothetical protein